MNLLAELRTAARTLLRTPSTTLIAVVVLGRWNPIWVLVAALFFGGASALQFLLQALGIEAPYQLFLVLPYVLTLAALAGWVGRARAPAALALPWEATK